MSLLELIKNTPIYVWLILARLIYISFSATKKQTLHVLTLFILPVVLIALKYKIFFETSSMIVIFLSGLSIGTILGFYVGQKTQVKILKNIRSIEIPGSYQTLIIVLSYFCIRYFFGFLHATNPALAMAYAPYETCIIGAFSGLILGKALAFTYKYIQHR